MQDRDQKLAEQFQNDSWWQNSEPSEIRRIGESVARSTAMNRVAGNDTPPDKKEDSKDNPQPHERDRYVANDSRSTGLDGFGSIALDRVAYFAAERLSDNVNRSPEGYLICKNAVIGRTGFQKYKVSEIVDPEGLLEGYRADEEIDLYRGPEEVFSRQTLASFEGKSFCLGHPTELLGPETEKFRHEGHITNIRRGSEPLGNGELPLLADIIITGADAIRSVLSGERELSCGYTYRLARTGFRWEQRDIIGNHVALVPQGRAGSAARIYDHAIASPKRRRPLNENEELEIALRERGRRQVELIRNSIRIRRQS
jgi:hypothetical protein